MNTEPSIGFPGGSDGKESACNAGNLSSIPGSGRSPGEGNGYCEKKVSLALSIHKKCHSHQRFMASKCQGRLPKLLIHRMLPTPTVIAEDLGECMKQGEQGNKIGPR